MAIAVELIVCEFVFLAIACGVLMFYYKGSLVTWDVTLTVYLAWVLGFAAVLLLPYDLSLAVVQDLQSEVLVEIWAFVYWSTFLLAWVVLPIQMEYHASGHFSVKDKLLDAIKRLLFAAVIALVLGLVYVVYMVASSGLTIHEVFSFMMAMSNTYGVLLITVLMGSGLVGVPKRLWNMADSEAELRRLYLSANAVEESYQESRYELEDCEVEIRKAVEQLERAGPNSIMAREVGPQILQLKTKASNFIFASRATTSAYIKDASSSHPVDYSEKNVLVNLHARLMKCQLKARASERRWRVLIATCKQHQDAQNMNLSDADVELGWCLMPVADGGASAARSSFSRSIHQCFLALYKFWINYCFHTFCRLAAIVLGICSCLILWSELVMASNLQSPLGWLMGAYLLSDAQPVIVQGVAFLALAYMSLCTYWTLFRMNIGWSYRLQGPQLSPPSSLIFNGEYLSRLQFALGYNFLLCINVARSEDTAFRTLMQNIEIIPVFGTSFTVYVPIIMIMIAAITFFDGFGRLLAFLGIDSEDAVYTSKSLCPCGPGKNGPEDMDASLLEKYNSGKAVIASELRTAALQLESLAKTRASTGGTLLGSGSGHAMHNQGSTEVAPSVRNTILSPFVSDSKPGKYTKVEMSVSSASSLRRMDDDEDELGPSIYSATIGNKAMLSSSSSAMASSSAGPSVGVSLTRRAIPGTDGASPARHSYRPVETAPSGTAAYRTGGTPSRNFTSKDFSFEDEDEEEDLRRRGRYADF